MRKSIIRVLPLMAAAAVTVMFTTAALASGNVDLFLGKKNVDRDFGSGRDIEHQDAAGLFFDWGRETWPVHIAFDLLEANQDVNDNANVHLDGSTGEIDLGMRWYPNKGSRVMPHLGGGLGLISGEVKVSSNGPNNLAFDDSKLGYWADAGIAFRLTEHFKLGGRIRYSKAKIDNPGGNVTEVDAGGTAWGANAGWTW